MVAVITVYLGRDGYTDVRGVPLSFIDCVYFATISLTTVGYGDLTPYSEFARLTNIVVITPLRILFLVVLVGTTLQVLTERSRQAWKIQRWRSRVRNHTVVVGYGTKGKTAVAAILDDESTACDIVVVDTEQAALDHAAAAGLVTVHGDATRSDVLRLAAAQHASSIVVATGRDDTAVLVTLTAREIAPKATIVASIREAENQHLLQQSGANSVVVSSETAGRLLGIATTTPSIVAMIDDLLTPDEGFAIAERDVEQAEVGGSPRHLSDIVLGVVRDGQLLRVDAARGRRHRGRRSAAVCAQCGEVRLNVEFQLQSVPLLSRIGADRADQVRTDVDAATEGWAEAALLRLDSRNQVLVADGRVVLGRAKALADKPPPDAVFLGRIEDGRHVWAVRGPLEAPEDPDAKTEVADLRRGGQLFDDVGAQLVSSAAALLNWHAQRPVQLGGRLAHQADQGRLGQGQSGHRSRGIPAHRPGGDLPGA